MSTVYNLEPPTKGKVILKTTLGEIEVELWPKEAPKAVRNFVQLCLEGYYCGTIFHRVIKDFMVQGGDPSGTGAGGESIYGAPFKDEFHSRLKFNHRGLIACANEQKPHTNGSQFFITLEACTHLDRKHTIFGKVVGDSIYNVAHFNELHTDETDRPMDPPVFLDAEVVWNPFDDIVPRSTREEREAEVAAKRAREAEEARQERKKRKKNLGLLSFGEEAGAEEQEVAALGGAGVGSAFDAVTDDPRLLKSGTEAAEALRQAEEAAEAERRRLKASVKAALTKAEEGPDAARRERAASGRQASPSGGGPAAGADGEDDFDARMRRQALARREALGKPPPQQAAAGDAGAGGGEGAAAPKPPREKRDRQREALEAGKVVQARVKPSKVLAAQDTELMSAFQKRRLEAKARSRLAKEQGNNLAKLLAFKKRLHSGSAAAPDAVAAGPAEAEADEEQGGYDGKVRKGDDLSLPAAWRVDRFLDDYQDEGLDSLARHRLVFDKQAEARNVMAANFDDNYVVEDPLAERQEKWNRKEGAARRSQREWAAGQEGPLD